jgi:1-piperideine-2-carboxylate/1-pyrroline-2-carboxylate reductase [NAD(P)H]
MILNAHQSAHALPYSALADEIAALLGDASVRVPQRVVQTLPGGGHLFIMPAHDARIAMTKLITLTPANAAHGIASIQGHVMVFDNATGAPVAVLDGPTVTARRTAAVSLLAAQHLAAYPTGPLLIIGAGVQGLAHMHAFVQGLGVREVIVASRSLLSAQLLVQQTHVLFKELGVIGGQASVANNVDEALMRCTLVVVCTPANDIVLHNPAGLHPQAFVSAVGAYKAHMAELAPSVVQHFAQCGRIVVDTADAAHEAGDLIRASIDIAQCATLQHTVQLPTPTPLPQRTLTLFKSCGWAGWDLAAARLVVSAASAGNNARASKTV